MHCTIGILLEIVEMMSYSPGKEGIHGKQSW